MVGISVAVVCECLLNYTSSNINSFPLMCETKFINSENHVLYKRTSSLLRQGRECIVDFRKKLSVDEFHERP